MYFGPVPVRPGRFYSVASGTWVPTYGVLSSRQIAGSTLAG